MSPAKKPRGRNGGPPKITREMARLQELVIEHGPLEAAREWSHDLDAGMARAFAAVFGLAAAKKMADELDEVATLDEHGGWSK